MINYKFIAASALAALTTFSSSASAQDFQQDWQGFYVGAKLDLSMFTMTSEDPTSQFLNDIPTETSLVYHGGIIGGYNYMLEDNLLIGAEFQYTSQLAYDDFFTSNEAGTTGLDFDYRLEGITTLRARAGFVQGNALAFITAGIASASANFETVEINTGSANVNCGNSNCAALSEDLLGITLGGGIDWAFRENFIGRIEVQHYIFQSSEAPILNAAGDPSCNTTDQCTIGYTPKGTTFSIGISYMF
jgi:opacity protein-like surface antigen